MPERLPSRTLAVVAAVVAVAVAIWLDVTTGLWQELVIVSGIAAGLVTFLLTALFLEQWLARAQHRRWLPVTRIALTDILHAMADEEASQITRGVVAPRRLTLDDGDIATMLEAVHTERTDLTRPLERWAAFLASSADVQDFMVHVADIAVLLDEIRDAITDAEREGRPAADVAPLIERYNNLTTAALAEIQDLLRSTQMAERTESA